MGKNYKPRHKIITGDPVFNSIQEIIWLYNKYKIKANKHGFPVTFDGFMLYLVREGWSYDFGEH